MHQKNKTLFDMLVAEPTLFSGFSVPTGITAQSLTELIKDRSGLLCTWIQDAARLKTQITAWSTYRTPQWEKALAALTAAYNPIHNYDREELGSEEIAKHKGTKVSTNEDVSETPATMTNTGSVVAYDSNAEAETGKSVSSPGSTSNRRTAQANANYTTYQDVDAYTYDKDVHSFTNRITRGNIGVTKSQDMVRDEVQLRIETDLYELIAAEFESKFCMQIY